MNMKQIFLIAMVAVAGLAFGAANDTIVTFSTKGPDRYKDGSKVLDGEYYALVWTKAGETFGGFNADGSLVDAADVSKFVVGAPLAKDAHCPTTLFQISADDADQYEGGTFALYLLDTRIMGADGKPMLRGADFFAGKAPALNAAGQVSTGDGEGTASFAINEQRTIAGGETKLATVGVYSKLPDPKISGFVVKGANVEITVDDMCEAAEYFVLPGSTPSSFSEAFPARPTGKTFKFKPSGDAKFFKVIGVRKFE